MRTNTSLISRSLLPLLCGLSTLVACDTMSAPEPAARVAGTANADKSGNGGGGLVPFFDSASFHPGPGAVPITCAPNMNNQTHTVGANQYVGTGPATHMGMSDVEITFTYCRTINVPIGGDVIVWASEGPATFVAANGDALHLYFWMTQFLSGKFTLDSANVTGGSGRFANASGQLKGAGFITRPTLVGWYKAGGMITRPNS